VTKPTQKLFDFDAPAASHAEARRYEPSEEAVTAVERLKNWLWGARGPVTEIAEETLRAVEKTLIEGKKGWFHAAEDGLEAVKLRNGKTDGDDIPATVKAGEDFQRDVEDVLDAMHEMMLGKGRGR